MIEPSSAPRALAQDGVAFAPEIVSAARRAGLDPLLLAAVAAQETGGPGANSGRNIVGDGGHGHGIFQIDDRWHSFARTSAALDPQANANYAATMISGLLQQYGGDTHKALSAYNAGNPNATGTVTQWQDGRRLGYADSVLRHYAQLGGSDTALSLSAESAIEQQNTNALASFASIMPPPQAPASNHSYRQLAGLDNNGNAQRGADPASIVFDDGTDDSNPYDIS